MAPAPAIMALEIGGSAGGSTPGPSARSEMPPEARRERASGVAPESAKGADRPRRLAALFEELPGDLARQVVTHASWSERRADSYDRLAFLGDSVLGLAITAHLYPRLQADRFGAGRLTKIRAQAVSGSACRAVAERLGIPERLRAAAPGGTRAMTQALETERVLASVVEAVIGACYLHAGYDRTAEAVVEAFAPEIEHALNDPVDFKSALQEMLARSGRQASYTVSGEQGPPHRRTFEVTVSAGERALGHGRGPSKKHAEQLAAREALERLGGE
jgi:ribonuclease-3